MSLSDLFVTVRRTTTGKRVRLLTAPNDPAVRRTRKTSPSNYANRVDERKVILVRALYELGVRLEINAGATGISKSSVRAYGTNKSRYQHIRQPTAEDLTFAADFLVKYAIERLGK